MKDVAVSIDQLKNDVQGEDSADTFMEPGKKRRGRPKGSKNRNADEKVNPMGGGNSPPPAPELIE